MEHKGGGVFASLLTTAMSEVSDAKTVPRRRSSSDADDAKPQAGSGRASFDGSGSGGATDEGCGSTAATAERKDEGSAAAAEGKDESSGSGRATDEGCGSTAATAERKDDGSATAAEGKDESSGSGRATDEGCGSTAATAERKDDGSATAAEGKDEAQADAAPAAAAPASLVLSDERLVDEVTKWLHDVFDARTICAVEEYRQLCSFRTAAEHAFCAIDDASSEYTMEQYALHREFCALFEKLLHKRVDDLGVDPGAFLSAATRQYVREKESRSAAVASVEGLRRVVEDAAAEEVVDVVRHVVDFRVWARAMTARASIGASVYGG